MRFRPVALAGTLIVVLTGGYGFHESRADPVFRAAAVSLPDWPTGAPPITVALVSDIHLGNAAMDADRLTRIVTQVDSHHPDLVMLAGDFVAGHDPVAAVAAAKALTVPLAGLRAPLGVVAVLGNHDEWTRPRPIADALRKAGVTVLQNEAVRRGPIAIAGIGDAFSGHDDVPKTLAALRPLAGARVALTHSPDLSPRLPATIALVLAGHTHCGQVLLPGIGPVLMRSPLTGQRLYDPRYRCGIVRGGGRTTIVTAGLGGEPFRVGAPPDIWLVRLGPRPRWPVRSAAMR